MATLQTILREYDYLNITTLPWKPLLKLPTNFSKHFERYLLLPWSPCKRITEIKKQVKTCYKFLWQLFLKHGGLRFPSIDRDLGVRNLVFL